MKCAFITYPLLTRFGSVRPALLLSIELIKRGFDVTLISPSVSEDVKGMVEEYGIQVIDLGVNFYITPQLPSFEAWVRALLRRKDSLPLPEDYVIINTSSCIIANSDIYYAQGLMTRALEDMAPEMPKRYSYTYRLFAQIMRALEKRMVRRFRILSKMFIANSKFCSSMYEDLGIKVDDVIPPPLDCELFKPTASKPSMDFVLTYFGVYSKESKFSVIKRVADAGIRIKAFGYKAPYIPTSILNHPNIEFLGRVTDEDLVGLYSNALFTFFTFTHEPFGYIPIESMSCGTPVLTYNKQGPSESVIDGSTGWLADCDEKLVELAVMLWREGYPSWMRSKCRERALEFDVNVIADKWLEIIKQLNIRWL